QSSRFRLPFIKPLSAQELRSVKLQRENPNSAAIPQTRKQQEQESEIHIPSFLPSSFLCLVPVFDLKKKKKNSGAHLLEERMARAGGISNAVNVGIAVQADWENREFISHISLNIRRLFDFLLQFRLRLKQKWRL
ncbi:unnamed protein product, partial [Linum tenue]